jgi:hypothetical protein
MKSSKRYSNFDPLFDSPDQTTRSIYPEKDNIITEAPVSKAPKKGSCSPSEYPGHPVDPAQEGSSLGPEAPVSKAPKKGSCSPSEHLGYSGPSEDLF